MKLFRKNPISLLLTSILIVGHIAPVANADGLTEALTSGETGVDMRLRYESVEQENLLEDASALTLRTLLSYSTAKVSGFSAKIELEDTRIVAGEGDYTVGPTGYNLGQYSVIADPEHTELDQGYIQYASAGLTAKLGRQVLTFDNHRFVGHVGWRQDRQTFDGLSVFYAPNKQVNLSYAYLDKRNRIFADNGDIDSKDHLLNGSFKTEYGTLAAYSYLLEVDNGTSNALDTYGIRFNGSKALEKVKLIYGAEYASQISETSVAKYDADYYLIEGGVVVNGITVKLGYEVLGSDDGMYGFSTPLATLHKFNGWADQFLGTPAQGLKDTSITFKTKLLGGGFTAIYHDFSADHETAQIDDLGSELDMVYSKKFAKHYSAGIKFASYSGGSGKVDAEKLWVWVGAKF